MTWNLVSVRLETVLVSVQDRCMVCAERTMGTEIVLDATDGTPRFKAQEEVISVCLEIMLILTQDRCMVCPKRTMASETILDATDGTPR
jgi:hypothetical protein